MTPEKKTEIVKAKVVNVVTVTFNTVSRHAKDRMCMTSGDMHFKCGHTEQWYRTIYTFVTINVLYRVPDFKLPLQFIVDVDPLSLQP
jgi:hypothetical protein